MTRLLALALIAVVSQGAMADGVILNAVPVQCYVMSSEGKYYAQWPARADGTCDLAHPLPPQAIGPERMAPDACFADGYCPSRDDD